MTSHSSGRFAAHTPTGKVLAVLDMATEPLSLSDVSALVPDHAPGTVRAALNELASRQAVAKDGNRYVIRRGTDASERLEDVERAVCAFLQEFGASQVDRIAQSMPGIPPAIVARVVAEARMAGRLRHTRPGVVDVHRPETPKKPRKPAAPAITEYPKREEQIDMTEPVDTPETPEITDTSEDTPSVPLEWVLHHDCDFTICRGEDVITINPDEMSALVGWIRRHGVVG